MTMLIDGIGRMCSRSSRWLVSAALAGAASTASATPTRAGTPHRSDPSHKAVPAVKASGVRDDAPGRRAPDDVYRERYRGYLATLGNGAATARNSLWAAQHARMIPAFARKYGLRCSACHTAWPELTPFGQAFRDNGYQLGNERDSPIFQSNGYWPVAIRVTPQFHLESSDHQLVDAVPGDANSGVTEKRVTSHGFDLSGMDFWTAGTLWKDISFVVLFASDETGTFHFEAVSLRFDNLAKSPWLNLKLGKFELDNLISEKRFLFLSGTGGSYQTYHFTPDGSSNAFGIGDNQIGAELSGHSFSDKTRYALAVLSSSDGNPGLATGSTYDASLSVSQAFDAGRFGVERIGLWGYLGQRSTYYNTSGGEPIPGSGLGNKPFYRVGLAGDFFLDRLEFLPFAIHGYDNAYLGTSTAANQPLPDGAAAPTWNGGFLETHYYVSPQLVLTQRVELIRMAKQALPGTPSDQGNVDAYAFGTRWMPFMYSRAGLAVHGEYAMAKRRTGGFPGGADPASTERDVWSSSVLFALDFDF